MIRKCFAENPFGRENIAMFRFWNKHSWLVEEPDQRKPDVACGSVSAKKLICSMVVMEIPSDHLTSWFCKPFCLGANTKAGTDRAEVHVLSFDMCVRNPGLPPSTVHLHITWVHNSTHRLSRCIIWKSKITFNQPGLNSLASSNSSDH